MMSSPLNHRSRAFPLVLGMMAWIVCPAAQAQPETDTPAADTHRRIPSAP